MLHNKLGEIYRDVGKNKDPVCNQKALTHFVYVAQRDPLHDGVRDLQVEGVAVATRSEFRAVLCAGKHASESGRGVLGSATGS